MGGGNNGGSHIKNNIVVVVHGAIEGCKVALLSTRVLENHIDARRSQSKQENKKKTKGDRTRALSADIEKTKGKKYIHKSEGRKKKN